MGRGTLGSSIILDWVLRRLADVGLWMIWCASGGLAELDPHEPPRLPADGAVPADEQGQLRIASLISESLLSSAVPAQLHRAAMLAFS